LDLPLSRFSMGTSGMKRFDGDWSRPLGRLHSGAGYPKMRSDLGTSAPGFFREILDLPKRQGASWICTKASGKEHH
jgi:hypothetical protein